MWQNQLWAYSPYAREIELWADIFPQVHIACPLQSKEPPKDYSPLEHKNIVVRPVPERGGNLLKSKIRQVISLPNMVWKLISAMRQADAIQVRSPGNLGLLGAALAPLFSKHICAKYAGQWLDYPGEATSYRLQKRILSSKWFRGPVFVYGRWPNQPSHIIPFFTSVMEASQMAEAKEVTKAIRFNPIPRILFVGRLSTAKNVDKLLYALSALRQKNIAFECHIIGEGPEGSTLRNLSHQLGLTSCIQFDGGLPFPSVLNHYSQADILVLASETEGWPKAVAEGMAFGLVCVASNRGLVPQMLSHGRGILVEPGDILDLQNKLEHILQNPNQYLDLRQRAADWAQQFTTEQLRSAFASVLSEWWNIDLEYAERGKNWRPTFD